MDLFINVYLLILTNYVSIKDVDTLDKILFSKIHTPRWIFLLQVDTESHHPGDDTSCTKEYFMDWKYSARAYSRVCRQIYVQHCN